MAHQDREIFYYKEDASAADLLITNNTLKTDVCDSLVLEPLTFEGAALRPPVVVGGNGGEMIDVYVQFRSRKDACIAWERMRGRYISSVVS